MASNSLALLATDAKNRAVRTFLQGLAIDLAVAIASVVLASTDKITDRASLITVCVALAKTAVTTIAAYVMRRFLDGSSVPTPLPPAPAAEPADDSAVL